ncbi:MAG: crosslink repair DNA glycosylase YcaQ family protein [Geodermatophilaceae bacterium]
MQAQYSPSPYIALHSQLKAFAVADLESALGSFAQHGKFSLVAWPRALPANPAATALVVRRYLRAFGPATREDIAGLRHCTFGTIDAALATLQPLRRATDELGRDLLDLPRAPLPPEDTQPPTRLLARWDAAVLSHRDRRTVLVDGLVAGSWSHAVGRDEAVLTVRLLRVAVPDDLAAEADRMLAVLAPHSVRRTLRID